MSKQRGGALLAVLWLSVALSSIAMSVAVLVRGETERTAASGERLRAYYLATASIERAILWVQWGAGTRNPDGTPRFYQPPMPYIRMPYPSGEAVVEMIPEASRLSLNTAPPADLARLLMVVGADPAQAAEIASAIVDWRTPGGVSPFDRYYLSFRPSFRGRHASFEEVEELLLVRGVTPELFYGSYIQDRDGRLVPRGGLKDCVSVWGSNGPFDINTAHPALLVSLGVPVEAARAIVAQRLIRPFRSAGEALAMVGGVGRITVGGGTIWTIRATARAASPNGQLLSSRRTVSATVKFLRPEEWNPPFHILRWNDDAWSDAAIAPPDRPVLSRPTSQVTSLGGSQ
jgi:general secretion pathway protein K